MLPPTYTAVILLSLLSGLTSLIGVALALCFKASDRAIAIGIGFSAGIMLLISFLEILPEALAAASTPSVLGALILGFLLILSLDFLIPHIRYIKEEGKLGRELKTAYLVAFGFILHDFPEGFAMANSYILAPTLGLLVSISIAVHNIPEEFAMAVPLVLTKKRGLLIKVAILSALAEPLGAVFGLLAVSVAAALNPLLMAFAAGAMIFVSLDELLPMALRQAQGHPERSRGVAQGLGKIPFFALGVGLATLTYAGLALVFKT